MTDARRDGAPAAPAIQAGARSSLSVARPGAFALAVVGTALIVGLAGLLIALEPPRLATGYLPPLAGLGFLIFALLIRHTSPGLSWASLVLASLIASGVPIDAAREADPGAGGVGEWLVAAVRAVSAAIFTVTLAAVYATRPERRLAGAVTSVTMLVLAWFIAACLLVIGLIVTGNAAPNEDLTWIDVATLPTALFVDLVLLLLAFGALGAVRAAAIRADARAATTPVPGGEHRAGSALERMAEVLRELLPGMDPGDVAVEAERTRLAGDLHAAVLPALRRAIAEVEAGGPPELLGERLKTVDMELERLMADRWPVVLDTFGLVPALEELAERLESDHAVTIEISVETDAGRPPRRVERAAWRATQLALDNAVRHASPSRIGISVATAPDGLTVSITDDGRGFDVREVAARPGRGLADIRLRVESVGGEAAVNSTVGSGSTVSFVWTAPAERDRLQRSR